LNRRITVRFFADIIPMGGIEAVRRGRIAGMNNQL
jgi:hypothetical protein